VKLSLGKYLKHEHGISPNTTLGEILLKLEERKDPRRSKTSGIRWTLAECGVDDGVFSKLLK